MSEYGWVKKRDELLEAVGLIHEALGLLGDSDDRQAKKEARRLLLQALGTSIVNAAALEWQPMETAPKDGEAIILLTAERLPVIAFWAEWETGGDADNGDQPEWDSGWCLNGCQTVVMIGKMVGWARISLPVSSYDKGCTRGGNSRPAKAISPPTNNCHGALRAVRWET